MQDNVRHCQKGIKRRFVTPTLAVKLASFGPASWPNVKKVPNDWFQGLDLGELASEISRFGYAKAVNDKKVPDRVGSDIFVLH